MIGDDVGLCFLIMSFVALEQLLDFFLKALHSILPDCSYF